MTTRPKAALAIGAILIGSAALYFQTKGQNSSGNQKAHAQSRQQLQPQELYEQMFRHYAAMQAKAQELEQQHADASGPRFFYKREAKLSDQQARDLDNVASDCMKELARLDGRAKQLIDETRAQVPGGQLQKGQTPPPAPPELTTLQEAREAKVLKARDQLHSKFGDNEFARFDEFVHRVLAANMKSTEPGDKFLKVRPQPRQTSTQ